MATSLQGKLRSVDARVQLTTTCPPKFVKGGQKHEFICVVVLSGENNSGGGLASLAKLNLSRLGEELENKKFNVSIPQGIFSISFGHTFEFNLPTDKGQYTVILKIRFLIEDDPFDIFAEGWRPCDFVVE